MSISKIDSSGLASRGIAVGNLPVGTVLQVVNSSYSLQATTQSSSYIDSGLTATITPTSSTSKILVLIQLSFQFNTTTTGRDECRGFYNVVRNGSQLYEQQTYMQVQGTSNQNYKTFKATFPLSYVDSPATTSAVTYKTQIRTDPADGNTYNAVYAQPSNATSTITLMEIAA